MGLQIFSNGWAGQGALKDVTFGANDKGDANKMVRKPEFAKNIEVVGYHDLDGRPGFQMAMREMDGRYYLYLSHFRHSGWAIIDVKTLQSPSI